MWPAKCALKWQPGVAGDFPDSWVGERRRQMLSLTQYSTLRRLIKNRNCLWKCIFSLCASSWRAWVVASSTSQELENNEDTVAKQHPLWGVRACSPPSLYGACSWPVLSNSLGKGLLEVQSTFIWSVSIRTIFSKTFPLVFGTWASRRGNAKELARKIKSWDIKKVLPEHTVRKSLWKCPSLIATAILLRPCLGQQDGFGQKFDVLMWSGFNSPHNSASPGAWPVKRPRNKRDKP